MRKKRRHRLAYVLFIVVAALGISLISAGCASDSKTQAESPEYRFLWSGGSGRAVISCDSIEEEDGQLYAEITFSRASGGASSYDMVRVDGQEYEGSNTFRIPVTLNEVTEIEGRTTAMSTPHWISYSLFVGDGSSPAELEFSASAANADEDIEESAENVVVTDTVMEPPVIDGLTYESSMELDYAECFAVYYYSNDFKVLDIPGSGDYLIVPEGAETPEGLSDEITMISSAPENIYLAATSAMSLFGAIDAVDFVRLSGLDESGWYIDTPKAALASGDMVYAGSYSEPDYELLLSYSCDLAVESTMIFHAPEVKEMLEDLDIPVLIDRSSYETQALGRTEWIKLYGALMDREDEAFAFFDEQKAIVEALADFENTGRTVAYFTVTSNGTVTVRRSDDYIPSMIEAGGGKYAFEDLENTESQSASVSISMEEFYSVAVDADYLVYNATIEDTLGSINDLIKKDALFEEFKAVQDGNVWQVDKSMYQSTDRVGQLTKDFNIMLTDGDESELTFLTHLS